MSGIVTQIYQVDPVRYTQQTTYYSNSGPFKFGGNLYIALGGDQFIAPPSFVHTYKSNDDGVTWTELDSVNAPTMEDGSSLTIFRDGSTLYYCYRKPDTSYAVATFDLTTELYVAEISGGPSMAQPQGLFVFSGGEVIAFSENRDYATLITGVWSASMPIDPSLGAGEDSFFNGALIDTLNTVHFFHYAVGGVIVGLDFYHTAVDSTGALSARQFLFNQDISVNHPDSFGFGTVLGSQMFVPFRKGVSATATDCYAYVSDSLGVAPSWSEEFIDSTITTTIVCAAFTDGTVAVIPYVVTDPPTVGTTISQFRFSRSTGNGVWELPTVLYDALTDPPANILPGFNGILEASSAITDSLAYGAVVTMLTDPFSAGAAFSVGPATVPPPPAPVALVPTPQITSGFVGPFTRDYLAPNKWFCCLQEEIPIHRSVNFEPPSCPIPSDAELVACRSEGEDPPYDRRTDQSIQLRKFGSIITPVPGADNLVLTFRVPLGYYGVIRGMLCNYTGTGFVPGSGDILWRLQVQRRWVKDYGAVDVQLGSSRESFPSEVFLVSGQKVSWYVNVPNTSGSIQAGASRIVCGVTGWIYPMQEKGVMGPRVTMAV